MPDLLHTVQDRVMVLQDQSPQERRDTLGQRGDGRLFDDLARLAADDRVDPGTVRRLLVRALRAVSPTAGRSPFGDAPPSRILTALDEAVQRPPGPGRPPIGTRRTFVLTDDDWAWLGQQTTTLGLPDRSSVLRHLIATARTGETS